MSGYDSASREAYARVDITAGQQRILSAFRPGVQITRQELVKITGLPINSVSGRCTELLEAGKLESLPAVDGRHPLRLKNAGRQMAEPATAAMDGTTRSPVREPSFNASVAAPLIAIVPHTGYQQPMSIESAKRICADKGNAFYEQAKSVLNISSRSSTDCVPKQAGVT